MVYCHECGEEITDIDTFCPFCGISLQPIIETSEKDESQEDQTVEESSELSEAEKEDQIETIAINGLDLPEIPNKDNPVEKDVGVLSKTEETIEPIDESIIEPKDKNKISDTDANSVKDDLIKPKYSTPPQEYVPEEKLLFTARSLNTEKPKKQKTDDDGIKVDKSADEITEKPDQPTLDKSSVESSLDDIDSEKSGMDSKNSQTESSMMSYEEAEVKEKINVEENVGEIKDINPDDEINFDFNTTIPYIPKKPDKVEEKQSEQEVIAEPLEQEETTEGDNKSENSVSTLEMPETPDLLKDQFPDPEFKTPTDIDKSEPVQTKSVSEELDKEDSSELIVDEPIAPPDDELKDIESAPIYDSVSIRAEDEEDGEISDTSFSSDITEDYPNKVLLEQAGDDSKPKQTDSTQSNKVPKSKTTPNIGETNTGGKKSQLKPLDEGTLLNERYEIIRKIGGGGMGAVYLASDKNLGGVLRAVKEMVQSYIEEEQQDKAINDFKRESLLLTSLEHPAIPTIYDYFYDEKEGRFYLVMKYINGGDLASRLNSSNQGRVDEETVTDWAIQITDVLNYLHNRQPPIVYRDLKPANIMIDGNTGRVMLIDFGIARWINKEEKGVTAVGTMGYAPPELFSGNVESSSDIYSLGSTMFHLLTGADPQSNPLLIFDFQKNPKPREINPQLSDQMETILMKMVEYNADKRFSSAIELKKCLEEHLINLKSGKTSFGIKDTPAGVSLTDEKVFCGFCGQKIVASDMFCAFCGAKQPIASKGVHGESYTSAAATAKLVIMGTNELEPPAYKIEKDSNLVGRRDPMSNIFPEVDLSKFDPQTKISRRHARIWREGNKFMVEDLGSSNGTFLMPVTSNSTKLMPNQPHILTNGDKLKLGDTTLHFVIG